MILLIIKCIHGLAPQYLCSNITMECEIALRNTRSFDSMNVFTPFENMSQSKNFVSTAGRLWNVSPADLKCDSYLNMFKFKHKQFILSGALRFYNLLLFLYVFYVYIYIYLYILMIIVYVFFL